MTVIQRYFLLETVKTFLLCLVCFYGLFVLIDYTNRSSHFHLSAAEFSTYYSYLFVRRVEILAPFALLVAVIRTLCNANMRHELTAMKASGVPPQRFLRPIIGLGLALTFLLYLNTQSLLPSSLKFIHKIHDAYEAEKAEKKHDMPVQHILLDDQSHLLYAKYDSANQLLVGTFWIRSVDDIYRMKSLAPLEQPPTGYFVDHLERNQEGLLVPVESWKSLALHDMSISESALSDVLTPPGDRSLSQLWSQLPNHKRALTMEEAQIDAAFYRKLTMPWLCFLALVAPIPACARFRRPLPVFFMYAVSLFTLVCLYLVLSAGDILAQSQVLSPLWALALPTGACVAVSLWRFVRLK